MAEPKFTRCPGCRTVFRVTPEQLALRGGQVRCGHCRAVFDGNAQTVSLAPSAQPTLDEDDLARGPATVTLRSSRALESVGAETPRAGRDGVVAPAAVREPSFEPAAARESTAAPESTAADHDAGASSAAEPRKWRRAALYAAAILLLAVLLALQAVLHYRDSVAARWPAAKPLLARMCEPLGCVVRPLRNIAGLSIDASDLQSDPAHKGLLILTATLRNRAPVALAYPDLELTLTDSGDRVVVRRALTPADYAGGVANFAAGFPANSELVVKTFIDASATTQAGYRLYLYYP